MIINSKKFKKFITSKKIKQRISDLSKKINKDYKDKNPIFICILDGSFMFATQLYKKIKIDSEISFVKVKSYKGTNSESLDELIGISQELENKDVVIVEDIVDTGKTIKYIIDKLKCKSIKIAALLSKPEIHKMNLDYVGFEIPDKFVIGYGLDYNGLGRNLKEIYQIS